MKFFLFPFLLALSLTGQDKPNIVFFLVDDMGYMDIACNGSKTYETPNIDSLAENGMRFTQAYAACGVCSPSRHAIMSGKYPARTGCTNFGMHMKGSELTLAEALKENGYTTWFVGKWHLGAKDNETPEGQGFDVNIGGGREGQPGSYFWPYSRNGKSGTLTKHLKEGGSEGEYLTDRLGDEAVKLVDSHNSDKPFLLYFAFYSVHTPIQAKKDDIAYFKKKIDAMKFSGPATIKEGGKSMKQVQDSPQFASMVKSVDDNVGKVLNKLKEKGLDKNTLIFFTSDNGGAAYYGNATCNLPLRGAKGWYYEGGIREPLLVSWPGKIKPGVSKEKVIGTDFYPTILDMIGADLKSEQHKDGISIKPALLEKKTLPSRNLYWYYPHKHGSGSRPASAMISGDYKLIQSLTTGEVQMFNLKKDLGEMIDLSKDMPEKAIELTKELKAWQKSLNLKGSMK